MQCENDVVVQNVQTICRSRLYNIVAEIICPKILYTIRTVLAMASFHWDSDVMNLTSSSSESDLEETSGSTTVAEESLQVQDSWDSIDRELDAMEQPPPEASVLVVAAAPPAQRRKKATTSAYIQVFSR
jgi:hypothetical protein